MATGAMAVEAPDAQLRGDRKPVISQRTDVAADGTRARRVRKRGQLLAESGNAVPIRTDFRLNRLHSPPFPLARGGRGLPRRHPLLSARRILKTPTHASHRDGDVHEEQSGMVVAHVWQTFPAAAAVPAGHVSTHADPSPRSFLAGLRMVKIGMCDCMISGTVDGKEQQ